MSGYGTPEQQEKTIEKMVQALETLGYNIKGWELPSDAHPAELP